MEYEDRLRISTPEGVDLELTLAGIGSRFTAALIDFIIQSLLFAAGVLVFVGAEAFSDDGGGDGSGTLGVAILFLFAFLITFGYDVLFEVRGGGRTPGKRLTGLRVVRASGRPVGFVTSATRNILRLVDLLPAGYAVGVAAIFASSRNQRVGDMAAGTIVVRDRKGGRESSPASAPAWASAAAGRPAFDTAGWDVSAVGAEEISTVRQFLERRPALTDAARRDLAADLSERLRGRVAGVPEQTPPEEFLEALAAAKAARADP